jgi:hypothetical protein
MRVFVFFLLIISLATACSPSYTKFVSHYTFKSNSGLPDYSNLDYWAAHPFKNDPSDSVPKPLRESFIVDSTVDVFFLYPTSYTDKVKSLGWNAPIDDANLNAKTDYSSILYQASIFNIAGRVFAPRYRQANYFAYLPITKEDTTNAIAAFELAYSDIKKAFEYYIANYNNGRPIIIASHSQGTTHAKRLLKEFFDGKNLQNKLVAAYLVGMPVEPDYFTSLKPCENENQTNCFCTWRTFKEDYKPDYVLKEPFTAIVTNPISWNNNQPTTIRKNNTGAVLQNFNKLVPAVTNACVKDGVLWAQRPHFFGSFLLRTKNYHIADYNFYYQSVRANVANRVKLFWKK